MPLPRCLVKGLIAGALFVMFVAGCVVLQLQPQRVLVSSTHESPNAHRVVSVQSHRPGLISRLIEGMAPHEPCPPGKAHE
jgi:hypothetical protein